MATIFSFTKFDRNRKSINPRLMILNTKHIYLHVSLEITEYRNIISVTLDISETPYLFPHMQV